jgi:hypothetical protein
MSNSLPAFLIALGLSGCSSVATLEPGAKSVTVVRETDRPGQCRVLGKIHGSSHAGDLKTAREGAENDLRNRAAKLKANFAMIESERTGRRGTSKSMQVVLGGKALACQTLEMDEADEKRREEALKKKEDDELKAQQEKERLEQEAKEKEAREKEEREAKEKEAKEKEKQGKSAKK